MRVTVASTGGATGGGAGGLARSRSARYSSTGRTTHPSPGAIVCAITVEAHAVHNTIAADTTHDRFIPVLPAARGRRSARHAFLRRMAGAIGSPQSEVIGRRGKRRD